MTSTMVSILPADTSLKTASATVDTVLGTNQIFQASRRPDFPLTSVESDQANPITVPHGIAFPSGANQTYLLTFPIPPGGGIWWVRVWDTVALVGTSPLPVYLDDTLIGPYTLGGRRLRDELIAQRPAINLFLTSAVTGKPMAIQSVRYDTEWNMGDQTPAILIKPLAYLADYEQVPRDRLTTLRYSIMGIIRSTDATYEADMIGQLAWALELILNQKCYETMQLQPGMVVNGGRTINQWTYSDVFTGNEWATEVEAAWEWEFIRGTQ